ncbi:MAG TPA: tyrosinase family protein [Solirubrobacteraceae bacterium]|nr:tyrosinase family protein [Solirubrobacteraceae bacterium]
MAATQVVSRENVETWAEGSPKLLLFRKALEGMQRISEISVMDERGYQWAAGVHGGFGGMPFCHHGDDHFLTWHRPYLLDIELKLRAQIARFADRATADEWRLPYWDWAAPDVSGIPASFAAETYDDGGQQRPNPLLGQPYMLPFPVEIDPGDFTWRQPRQIERLRALRPLVEAAFTQRSFHDFSTALEDPHNRVHGWTGGFMATYRSAFDPLFWVHHANIDRQFWQWQQGPGHMSSIPRAVRDFPCQPFKFRDIRAEAFFDTRALGYTYAEARRLVVVPDTPETAEPGAPTAPVTFAFGDVLAGFARARINVHGVRHPEQTCELRFFGNRDAPPDATTALTDEERYLGSYMLLGHGPCPGAPGHCDPDQQTGANLRPPHHLAPFDIFIDVTGALRLLADAADGDGPWQLVGQLIVVDATGAPLPTATVAFDNASLTLR